MAKVASLDFGMSVSTKKLHAGLNQARLGFRRFGRDFKREFAGIARAAKLAGAAITAAFTLAVRNSLSEADKFAKMARSLQLSGKEIQLLSHAAQETGIEFNKFTKVMLRVSQVQREAQNDLKTYTDELAKLGINQKEFIRASPVAALEMISAAMRKAGKSSTHLGALTKLLGARLTGVLGTLLESFPAFIETRNQYERMGGYIREDLLPGAEEFNDTLTKIGKVSMAQFSNAILASLPRMEDAEKGIKALGQSVYDSTLDVVELTKSMIDGAKAVNSYADAFGGLIAILNATLFGKIFGGIGKLVSKTTKRFGKLKKEIGGLIDFILKSSPLLFGSVGAVFGYITGLGIQEKLNAKLSLDDVNMRLEEERWAAALKRLGEIAAGSMEAAIRPSALAERFRAAYEEMAQALGVDLSEAVSRNVAAGIEGAVEESGDLLAEYARNFESALGGMQELQKRNENLLVLIQKSKTHGPYDFRPAPQDLVDYAGNFKSALGGMRDFGEAVVIPQEPPGAKEGIAGWWQSRSDEFQQSIKDFGSMVRENLRSALLTGNFKDIGKAFVESLKAALIDNILKNLGKGIMAALEGGGLSSFFGGFRAQGGPVSAGKAYVVGERGPELFRPSSMGAIIPNHAMVGGGGQTINNNFSIVGDVSRQTRDVIRRDAVAIANLLASARREQGIVS